MQIERRDQGDVLVLKILQKRVDLEVAPALKEALRSAIEGGRRRIVLDLGDVSFVDSSGLGAIVSGLKALGGNGNLVVCGVRGSVKDTFKLTRMDRVVSIFESEAEASAALARA